MSESIIIGSAVTVKDSVESYYSGDQGEVIGANGMTGRWMVRFRFGDDNGGFDDVSFYGYELNLINKQKEQS